MNSDKFLKEHFTFASLGFENTPKQIIKANMPDKIELGRYQFELPKPLTKPELVKIFKEVLTELGYYVTFNVTNTTFNGCVYLRILKIN